jgi:DNA polymerase III epsilon subunit-like protein
MDKRLLFVDVETGGVDPTKHPLFEVAMRCECGPDDPSAVNFSSVIRVSPEEWEACMPGALRVNQFSYQELQRGHTLDEVGQDLANWLLTNDIRRETVQWVGQNPRFDRAFLALYLGTYLEFVGLLPYEALIDVIALGKQYKRTNKQFKPTSWSGGNIALALGVEAEDPLHRAAGGVEAARRNFYELVRRLGESEYQFCTV